MAEAVGSSIQTSRTQSRQVNRPNTAMTSTESYFKVNVFIQLLDPINEDLENKLSNDEHSLYKLNLLLPSVFILGNIREINN